MNTSFADEEVKYAHPDGEDGFGTTYEERDVPSEMRENLDSAGRYELPSFINRTIRRGETECWVIDQNPTAETVFTCPQTVEVFLTYTCNGQDQYTARLPIELLDITPPEISVELTSNVQPQISFGGVVRYVQPNAVVPLITVDDACDTEPDVEYLLNGEPYVPGTPITGYGLKILTLSARDAWDNESHLPIMFEIRQRPSVTAAAVVQETECEFSPDGWTGTIRAKILISSANFDHRNIYFGSVKVLLKDSQGKHFHTSPIPVNGGITPGCAKFQDHLADIQIDDCVVVIGVESQFNPPTPNEVPAGLDIIGVTLVNGEFELEWGASTPNLAVDNAEEALLGSVGKTPPCGHPQPPPPPPLPPGCEHIQTAMEQPMLCPIPPVGWTPAPAPCAGGSGTVSSARAGYSASGNSLSAAYAPLSGTCGVGTSSICSVFGYMAIAQQLVGDCCDCSFSYSAGGTVQLRAAATGSATLWVGAFTSFASSSGTIQFWTPCDFTTTPIAAASASQSQAGSSVPNPDVVSVAVDPLNCVDHACSSLLIVYTQAMVQTQATATHVYSFGVAEALANCQPVHNVTPSASPCPPPDCED